MNRSLVFTTTAVALFSLASCSSVGMKLSQDATDALAKANMIGDTSAQMCFPVLKSAGDAIALPNSGVLSVYEDKMALRMAVKSPQCAPIVTELVDEGLKATPIFGNVLGFLGL
jgi:hypothetical protein